MGRWQVKNLPHDGVHPLAYRVLSCSWASANTAAARSTCSSVVNRPRPKRKLRRASDSLNPSSNSTWLGRGSTELHADPLLTATDAAAAISASPSTWGKQMFRFPGSRNPSLDAGPLICKPAIRCDKPCHNRAANPATRCVSSGIESTAKRSATAIATVPTGLRVPLRKPPCCPPPTSSGRSRTRRSRRRTYSSPTPLGA